MPPKSKTAKSEVTIEALYKELEALEAGTTRVRKMLGFASKDVPTRILKKRKINLSAHFPPPTVQRQRNPPTFGNFSCMQIEHKLVPEIPIDEVADELEMAEKVIQWARRVVGDMRTK